MRSIIRMSLGGAAEYLRSIRFRQGLVSAGDPVSHDTTVYLDNVTISQLSAPSSLWLFANRDAVLEDGSGF